MQHVQPDTQADPAHRVRAHRQADQGRIRVQGLLQLGPAGGDAVLPAGPGPLAARDRGRAQELRRQARAPGHRGAGRSSLSYANAHRPWQLFEQVFYGLYEKVAAKAAGRHKFRFKNKLVSIDSTVIDLSLSMYDWAKYQRTKGAVKLHLVLDHDGYLPCFGVDHRRQGARREGGAVDRLRRRHHRGRRPGLQRLPAVRPLVARSEVFFVTRMKGDALYEVVAGARAAAEPHASCNDQTIRLSGARRARQVPARAAAGGGGARGHGRDRSCS